MVKPFWRSKTLWALVAGAGVVVGQWVMGQAWLPPEAQAVVGFVIVTLLRFVTDTGIVIPGISDGTSKG